MPDHKRDMKGGKLDQVTTATFSDVDRVSSNQEGETESIFLADVGYEVVYRRAFSSAASFCSTVAITSYASFPHSRRLVHANRSRNSPVSALLVVAGYQIVNGGYWGLIW